MKKLLVALLYLILSTNINAQSWSQKGLDIDGVDPYDLSGWSVSSNWNGLSVAIGEPQNDSIGVVRVFEWLTNAWVQKGVNIVGENNNDFYGYSVSMDSSGNNVVIGAPYNNGNGSNSGHVRVYEWNGSAWVQKGVDIDGEAPGDVSGYSVSINSSGNTIAVGAPTNNDNGSAAGHARVYDWNGSSWVQRGLDIDGQTSDDSGFSLSLSADGNTLSIGSPGDDSTGVDVGNVIIYEWKVGAWLQKGNHIFGLNSGDQFGHSVSLSGDGNVVAIGAPFNDSTGTDIGHVGIWEWNGSAWIQRGSDIFGDAAQNESGYGISLSSDGKNVAIGAWKNNNNGIEAGHVKFYHWNTANWIQLYTPIDGEFAGDFSGRSVSLNNNGTIGSIGAGKNSEFNTEAGHVRSYQFTGMCLILDTILVNICYGDSLFAGGNFQTTTGLYMDTLVSFNNCDSVVFTVLTVNTLISINSIVSPVNALNLGAIDLTVSGGSSPYNYSWSNGATSEDISNLISGSYSVNVIDIIGCSETYSAFVNDTCNMSLSINSSGSNCSIGDGSANASVFGGTSPFNYYWTNGDTTATADSLFAGVYTITVTDDIGCVAYGSAIISSNTGPSISSTNLNVSCNNENDGSIDLTVTGGSPGYTFSWSNAEVTEDILNLTAGHYQVQVTDLSGCVASASIEITEPTPISISLSTLDATCGNADGEMYSSVTGGTSVYNYLWSSGGNSANEIGVTNGIYTLTVTDTNNCVDSAMIVVNESNGPIIFLDTTTSATCGGLGSAYISIYGNAPPYNFLWSNGGLSQNLLNVPAGSYSVAVTDSNGCVSNLIVNIANTKPATTEICMVTVDSITNTNIIIWEKFSLAPDIAYFNIYREGFIANQFDLIGSVHVDSLSEFNDPNSNTNQHSWRYRLSAVDSCGMESDMSNIHKTIHLMVNYSQNNYYLFWNHYEGFSYPTYFIHRYTPSNGWQAIDTISSSLNTYTDLNQPQGNVFYSIETLHPTGCTSTAKANNHNSTRSNKNNKPSGDPFSINEQINSTKFLIYPNPAKDFLTVKFSGPESYDIVILDVTGKLVYQLSNQKDETKFDTSQLINGLYFIKLKGINIEEQLKLLISK